MEIIARYMNIKNNTEKIWDLISKRWNLRILKDLDTKTITRFNELKQSIHGISSNLLSTRLNELEKLGLIKKISSNSTPSYIGYTLTEKCENLKKILVELDFWISSYNLDKSIIINTNDSIQIQKLLKFLKKEIPEVEFNFIKDKLLFSNADESLDLVNNLHTLENIIHELYGDEYGNKILKKLQDYIKLL